MRTVLGVDTRMANAEAWKPANEQLLLHLGMTWCHRLDIL